MKELTENKIIAGCRIGDSDARRALYERYGGVLYSICCRYINDRVAAEDILHDSIITIFSKIKDYRGDGSFEGWCKRITVNTALGQIRKNNPLDKHLDIDSAITISDNDASTISQISNNELMESIQTLPDGYRTILNLYAIEGYSHKEIGELLQISEVTSRSQYSRARSKLIDILNDKGISRNYNSD